MQYGFVYRVKIDVEIKCSCNSFLIDNFSENCSFLMFQTKRVLMYFPFAYYRRYVAG